MYSAKKSNFGGGMTIQFNNILTQHFLLSEQKNLQPVGLIQHTGLFAGEVGKGTPALLGL